MNLPPKPVTRSQEMAAVVATVPAPPSVSDPDLEQLVEMISRSEAPKREKDRALITIARELRRVSGHDGEQDLTIASLRADLHGQAQRLEAIERETRAQSQTLGGHAAQVALAEPVVRARAEVPVDGAPPTVMGTLERIQRSTGRGRLMMIALVSLEIAREAWPIVKHYLISVAGL